MALVISAFARSTAKRGVYLLQDTEHGTHPKHGAAVEMLVGNHRGQ
jgi:hypothetical protein